MEQEAYRQYLEEAEGWLHKGRRYLLEQFVHDVFGEPGGQKLKILEIGAGCGKSADCLARYGEFHAVEVEPTALDILGQDERISKLYPRHIPFDLDETYDLIVAMDVIEHIEDDQAAFDWIHDRLKPGGVLFVTVPAYQWMFSQHDVALNHFRRYSLGEMHALNRMGMEALLSGYFNFTLFPLAASTRMLSRLKGEGRGQARKQSSKMPGIIDRAFYAILQVESRLMRTGVYFPWGLSVVVAFRKGRAIQRSGTVVS